MSETWDASRCNDRAGFLFSHDCSYLPVNECHLCQRPICDEHTRRDEASEPICVSCAKSTMGAGKSKDPRRATHSAYHDDPYFYGGYHYSGYGYYGPGYWGHRSYQSATSGDSNNFTAGDSESLTAEDETTFESDMSES